MTDQLRAQFKRVFVNDPDGAAVLEHLTALFYDRQIFVPGGSEGARQTDFNAGRQDVVGYVIRMCMDSPQVEVQNDE